jgi:hypothetical protein
MRPAAHEEASSAAPTSAHRRATLSVDATPESSPTKPGARAEAVSPVFERPRDSPGRDSAAPSLAKPPPRNLNARHELSVAKPPPRLVLPPSLADRPCDLDAMPKERRELYKNVPCCGGRGCPQCSLMACGFR